jgi:hypothetical protein
LIISHKRGLDLPFCEDFIDLFLVLMQHYVQENTTKLQKPSFLLCSRWRKRMWYETETKMSMVPYAFCVMNINIDYSQWRN